MRLALAVLLVVSTAAAPARAQQCAAVVSECRTCHEVRGERPVVAGPLPWHVDHAFADFCARCHGGDAQATTASAAHVGVRSPLGDVIGTCGACHGADAEGLSTGYAAFVARGRSARPPPPAVARPPTVWGNVVAAALALAVAVGGGAYVVRNERRLRAAARGGA